MRPGLRRRVVLATTCAFTIGLILLLGGFNWFLGKQLSSDADRILRSRAAAQLANIEVSKGTVRVNETPGDTFLDGQAWVFDHNRRVLERPLSGQAGQPARRLAASRVPSRTEADDTRLLARPIRQAGRRLGTVVAGVSLSPYEHTQRVAFIASGILGLVLLAFVSVLSRRTLTVALRPVSRMTEQAATWSERDLHRRFAVRPPEDELNALASTLNGLLGRLDASLQHEQRFSAEVAHELRTPLARQRAEVELASRDCSDPDAGRALRSILRDVDRMTVMIDTLVAAAQAEADPGRNLSDALTVAREALEIVGSEASELGIRLEVRSPGKPLAVCADRDYAVQVLLPVVSNAVRHASGEVRIDCSLTGEIVRFEVIDDGPGLTGPEATRVFEPGVRGASAKGTGAGLGLSLARRLARSAGGEVSGATGPGGRFEVVLPAA